MHRNLRRVGRGQILESPPSPPKKTPKTKPKSFAIRYGDRTRLLRTHG